MRGESSTSTSEEGGQTVEIRRISTGHPIEKWKYCCRTSESAPVLRQIRYLSAVVRSILSSEYHIPQSTLELTSYIICGWILIIKSTTPEDRTTLLILSTRSREPKFALYVKDVSAFCTFGRKRRDLDI